MGPRVGFTTFDSPASDNQAARGPALFKMIYKREEIAAMDADELKALAASADVNIGLHQQKIESVKEAIGQLTMIRGWAKVALSKK